MDFQSAYQTYIRLKKQFEQGQLNADEFEKQVNDISATDIAGALWQIGVSTGKWYRLDGQQWVEDIPPEIMAPPPLPPFAPKATFTPPPPPIQPVYAPGYPAPAEPKTPWVSVFLVAGLLGLCCLAFGVGGWLVWNYSPTPEPSAIPFIPSTVPPTAPIVPPSVPPVSPVAPPQTPSETPAKPEADTILYQDDFSNPESGFTRQIGLVVTNYIDGSYSILVSEPNFIGFGLAMQNLGDVRMEVDTKKKAGSDDNDHGPICRLSEDTGLYSYYFFVISSQGFAAIGKTVKNEAQYLWSEKVQPAGLIKSGTATNHLRADCKGSTLTLYVNGQKVASVNDTAFTSGDVGLLARTWTTAGAEILYDNFVVYKP